MALTLTAYAIAAGYVLALSHNDLLVGGGTRYLGGFVSPRVNPPGGFFGVLSQDGVESQTILARALGTDGTTTPTQFVGVTGLRSLLRFGGVTYAAMVLNGRKCGIGTVADDGVVTPYNVANLQEAGLASAISFDGYQPSQIVADPASNRFYFALGEGNSAASAILTRLRIMEVDLSLGQPITPTTWIDPYGFLPATGGPVIPGIGDDRSARPTSLALSPDGTMLYLAVSSRTGTAKSRILGFRRSDKVKTLDILIDDWVNGILLGAGTLAGKMLIKRSTGVDEYDLASGVTQALMTGDLDTSYTYGFSAFGTNQAYFHTRPGGGATLGMVYRLTVPGLVGVDPGGTPPPAPDPPSGLTSPGDCEGAQVSLSWTPFTNALSYAVYRGGTLLQAGITGTSYVDTTALVGVVPAYSYTLTVTTAAGTSAQSAAYVRTPCSVPDPDPKTGDCCGYTRRPACAGTEFSRRLTSLSVFTRRKAHPCEETD